MTHVIVLGATGSVGAAVADVITAHRDQFVVDGLVAHQSGQALWDLGLRLGARWIGLTDENASATLVKAMDGPEIVSGMARIIDYITQAPHSKVVGAMSGFSGLVPTLAALERGHDLLLANKETMVAAGDLVRSYARVSGSQIIPVDSEHSAIFQCLNPKQPVRRLILTCSGGPFRGRTRSELEAVSVEEALNHPKWSMGKKISIDSATLMNKGLELIEAHQLFEIGYDQIDVVIHPQSIVHSMVEYMDGATLAQLGQPDMRVPVQVAFSWPDRWPLATPPLDWSDIALTFEQPDNTTFPALALAREVGKSGGMMPAIFNAANEVAVDAFLHECIPYLGIVQTVEATLEKVNHNQPLTTLDSVLEADRWGRQMASLVVRERF